ncbi:MAG: ATP-binding cassette domain-containing protein [Candidatus Hydrogenedentes bacterium]|nr:ATP-binding cassette domain-containing protein [Candidatus Hydrogenedentota bacterium]
MPCLEMNGVVKRFGGIPALRGASLSVEPGEIHGLVGENGAGKSTLINIASGVLRPDEGEIRIQNQTVHFSNPRQASSAGVAVVHQESELFSQLSLAENMLLRQGLVRGKSGLVRWGATYRKADSLMANLGEELDVRAAAGGLPVARRMMAEIAAALSANARILFLDEPTASLTVKESENLFARIRALRDQGVAIIYVSHRLEEVLDLCDRVTVMRDGQTVATHPSAGLTMQQLVNDMVGREIATLFTKRHAAIGQTILELDSLTDPDRAFKDISLEVRSGEIVGLYGFIGAGRSELGQSLFGMRKAPTGTIRLDGRTYRPCNARHAIREGIAYLPEDRLVQGIFREHSIRTNTSVAQLQSFSKAGIVSGKRETALTQRAMESTRVRAASMEQAIGTLSGGNQQKVVFGRWQSTDPRVLILDEPTRGVDVGAKAEIHGLIHELAERGAGIVLISSDLPEIMAISDRVVTVAEGSLTGQFDPRTDSETAVAAAAVPKSAKAHAATRKPSLLGKLTRLREGGLFTFILLVAGIMALVKPTEFATMQNFLDILANAALPAIMAQGVMLIICAGGIDISVGSMMGLVGAVAALAAKGQVPAPVCLAIAVGMGCGLSLVNGATSLIARIHPIIVTLAGLSIYRGIMRWSTGGREVMQLPQAYRALAEGTLLGVPKLIWCAVAVTVIVHVLLRYTLAGRRILALGNSESAARLIGLSKTRITLFVFAISGSLIGLTAVLHAGYYGKVQANTGEGWELQAIAAAVIGGTNILGGRGSAVGTLLGAFLIAMLYNILIIARVNSYWSHFFVGTLILAAVLADLQLQRLQRKSA